MAIQIYILSKLIEGNNYPYELKRQLSEPIPFDEFAGLTESKLYYHFEALTKQGLIEVVEVIREEHRPDKQVFAITEKGRKELPKKIYSLFEKSKAVSEMIIGLATLDYVDRDKVVLILEEKLQKHKERWNHMAAFREMIDVDESRMNFVNFMSDYFDSKAEHTAHWIEETIERIKQGKI
ncbi:Transcriptional regulator PadR-like family protein [Planococcus massiliensis]|uniref:Transcriptional regulator PadR-like family protein n=1 Tax=Planococcus massiliensis TaxID=1499687 RepID=A0A098EG13_9BACL|nr:PadR family transcriptional regulator [Planococcus massiliensis]CEG21234.1 Transcriptional regulator PadR-like family protein [Planococcus massiliensis]